LELLDSEGSTVAQEGDEVALTGSGVPSGSLERCRVSEQVWSAWKAEAYRPNE
jgi:hypothetical protein